MPTKKCIYLSIFFIFLLFYILDCVLLKKEFPFLLDMVSVWGGRQVSAFFQFAFSDFFFFLHVNSNITWVHCAGDKNYCSYTVHHCSNTVHTLKNIKNGSHDTIHTFKNYFATVFSVFSFSKNKFYLNGPLSVEYEQSIMLIK